MANKTHIVTDYEADESIRTLKAGKTVPAEGFSNWSQTDRATPVETPVNNSDGQLNEVELKFLEAVVKNPMCPSSEYSRLAHIRPNTLIKIRPKMVKDGWICEHKLEMNTGRGRGRIALSASDAGKKLIAGMKK
jgi:hypothetical protein